MNKNYLKPEMKVSRISLATYMQTDSPSSPVGDGGLEEGETFSSKEHLFDDWDF